jgi:undecaprenyl-diphosphatase
MFEYLIEKDIELFLFLNNLGTEQWDEFWMFITNKFSFIPLYLFLLYLTYRKIGLKSTLITLLVVVGLIAATDQTSNLFKYGFERLRPCHNPEIQELVRLVKARCGGLYAFFSGHASNTMAVAFFFGLLLKKSFKYLHLVLVVWALFVAYSRIYIGVHFPLDILVGMLVGGCYGFLFYKLQQLVIKKFIH